MTGPGIVTLGNGDTAKPSTPLGSSRGGDLAPRLHGRGSEDSVRAGGGEMAVNIEGVVGGRVEGQEPLG